MAAVPARPHLRRARAGTSSPFQSLPRPRAATCGATWSGRPPGSGCPATSPTPFPQNGLIAARVALLGADQAPGGRPSPGPLHPQEFGEGRNIGDGGDHHRRDPDRVSGSRSSALLEGCPSPRANKTRLKAASAKRRAPAASSEPPTFFTEDGEMFWGNDRLDQALEWAYRPGRRAGGTGRAAQARSGPVPSVAAAPILYDLSSYRPTWHYIGGNPTRTGRLADVGVRVTRPRRVLEGPIDGKYVFHPSSTRRPAPSGSSGTGTRPIRGVPGSGGWKRPVHASRRRSPERAPGDRMSAALQQAPSREDFAALLEESFRTNEISEGSVVKGNVVAIEKDVAVIDIGAKTEGRVALKEFTGPGRDQPIKVGDEVEVYLERIENALGEAVISRDKARREESWVKLEKAFENNEQVSGVIFNQVKGGFTVDLDGAVAFLPRSQVDIRPVRDVTPLMGVPQPFQILKMDRRRGNIVVSRRTVLEESRAEQRSRDRRQPRRGPGHRRRRQEHHRLRRVRRSRRHRRPSARHRHRLAARQPSDRGREHRPDGEGEDHQDQPRDAPHLARHEAAPGRSVGGHRGALSGRRASSRAASPTSPTTARSSSSSRASRA